VIDGGCESFGQLSWHVNDTPTTADGIRQHNRKHACLCKGEKQFCEDDEAVASEVIANAQ
jgi:hypothetical protein